MALSEGKVRDYIKRLLIARMRILCNHGFYGLLLMHMIYAIDENAETAYTDGERIAFGPDFLDDLSNEELDFVLMHEILHVVLQHCLRTRKDDPIRYNVAADIVVNSNIMLENGGKHSSITLSKYGESMHIAPGGKEGHLYTAEEVYEMLPPTNKRRNSGQSGKPDRTSKSGKTDELDQTDESDQNGNSNQGSWDDHSHWGKFEEDSILRDKWIKHFADTCETISIRDSSKACGSLPLFAKRLMKELMGPQTDWRSILNEFIQEEINDYSFSPPDRRFQDSPFFLPDFNEKDDKVENILFMIDTSGSMSDCEITAAFSEIKGAIDQFNGKLQGWLGFFDAEVIKPKPFSNFEEFYVIRPEGGGGTSFHVIFEYVNQHMQDDPPISIIILTDGYAPFPEEEHAKGIPVLWLLNNKNIEPPWGKVARITVS